MNKMTMNFLTILITFGVFSFHLHSNATDSITIQYGDFNGNPMEDDSILNGQTCSLSLKNNHLTLKSGIRKIDFDIEKSDRNSTDNVRHIKYSGTDGEFPRVVDVEFDMNGAPIKVSFDSFAGDIVCTELSSN